MKSEVATLSFAATCLYAVSEAIEIVPGPLVMVMFVPAVRVFLFNPVVEELPISN